MLRIEHILIWVIYAANALYAEELGRYVKEGGFDAVISTHLYGMESI